jgi:hypothetical protein
MTRAKRRHHTGTVIGTNFLSKTAQNLQGGAPPSFGFAFVNESVENMLNRFLGYAALGHFKELFGSRFMCVSFVRMMHHLPDALIEDRGPV